MEEAIDEKIKWLEENQDSDSESFRKQKKELEDIVQPIIAKLYQGAGGAPPPPGGSDDEDLKDELWTLKLVISADLNKTVFHLSTQNKCGVKQRQLANLFSIPPEVKLHN